jgi:hypothetical protein
VNQDGLTPEQRAERYLRSNPEAQARLYRAVSQYRAIEDELNRVAAPLRGMQGEIDAALRVWSKSLAVVRESVTTNLDPLLRTLYRSLAEAWQVIEHSSPPNWRDSDGFTQLTGRGNWHALLACAEDGIPVAYVPRLETLRALCECATYVDRCAVLVQERSSILDDCSAVLSNLDDRVDVNDQVLPLAQAALRALKEGHTESGQALALNVTEGFLARFIKAPKTIYSSIRSLAIATGDQIDKLPIVYIRLFLTLLPLSESNWGQEWKPGRSPGPRPPKLSRHASVHHPGLGSYKDAHAITAVMVMTSVAALSSEADYEDSEAVKRTMRP